MLKEKVFAYLVKMAMTQDVGGVELNPDDDFPHRTGGGVEGHR